MSKGKHDVVYTVGSKAEWDDNEELRYSIRSVVKHFEDLRNIYIVTRRLPEWCSDEIIHLKMNDPYRNNKDANLINKVLWACQQQELSEHFVRMSDDQYFLKNQKLEQFRNPYVLEDLNRKNNFPPGRYYRRLLATRDVLRRHQLDQYNYDTHMPVVVSKDLFPRIMLNYDYGNLIGYCINTLYFNSIEHFKFEESPDYNDEWRQIKATFEAPQHLNKIQEQIKGKTFMNFGMDQKGELSGLNNSLKKTLKKLYPVKTVYEK